MIANGVLSKKVDPRIINICNELAHRFLSPSNERNEITFFLCGGASKEEAKYRNDLGTAIKSLKSKYQYSVYYPESMFVELMFGHKKYDLLSLENLLADSVDSVVIPLQSPGTFTELGAFSNHHKLKNKLIIVIDPKHKRSRSFINLGPIRYLETQTESKIIYSKMEVQSIRSLATRLSDAARKISSRSPICPALTNPLSSHDFYLALIFILDEVPKKNILKIAQHFEKVDKHLAETIAEIVINCLITERKVTLKGSSLSIPPQGIQELLVSFKTIKQSEELLGFLSSLRIRALNVILRGNTYFEWKGAV